MMEDKERIEQGPETSTIIIIISSIFAFFPIPFTYLLLIDLKNLFSNI